MYLLLLLKVANVRRSIVPQQYHLVHSTMYVFSITVEPHVQAHRVSISIHVLLCNYLS